MASMALAASASSRSASAGVTSSGRREGAAEAAPLLLPLLSLLVACGLVIALTAARERALDLVLAACDAFLHPVVVESREEPALLRHPLGGERRQSRSPVHRPLRLGDRRRVVVLLDALVVA